MSQRVLLLGGAGMVLASLLLAAGGLFVQQARPLTMDGAQARVDAFVGGLGEPDLQVTELMEFDRNFYAVVRERSTGVGAFEVLVDKRTGGVGFESGPDSLWNAAYALGSRIESGQQDGSMTITERRATGIAQHWLNERGSGYTAGAPDRFYGYYTFHYQHDGRIAGMISVNGRTGAVWEHSWHGAFIRSRRLG